jgi:hypothetical protein
MFVGPDLFFPQIKDVISWVNQFPDSDSTCPIDETVPSTIR